MKHLVSHLPGILVAAIIAVCGNWLSALIPHHLISGGVFAPIDRHDPASPPCPISRLVGGNHFHRQTNPQNGHCGNGSDTRNWASTRNRRVFTGGDGILPSPLHSEGDISSEDSWDCRGDCPV